MFSFYYYAIYFPHHRNSNEHTAEIERDENVMKDFGGKRKLIFFLLCVKESGGTQVELCCVFLTFS